MAGLSNLSPRTSAQSQCKIVAYINIVLWFLMIVTLFILALVFRREIKKFFEESHGSYLAIVLIFVVLLFLGLGFQFYINMILYQGSKRRDYLKINRWVKISVFLLFLDMIGLIISAQQSVKLTPSTIIGITWRLFCIWIVNGYRNELKIENYRVLGVVPSAIAREESRLIV